jgi:6-phosphogluconolactonase
MEIIAGNKEEIINRVINIFLKKLNRLLEKQIVVTIGLPGGRSILQILEKINELDIEWERLRIFLVDERFVSLKSEESNFKLIKETLTKVSKDNLFSFNYRKDIENYSNELKKYNGRFDIVFLGVGEDGHVASLFPNHDSVKSEEQYFIKVRNSPKLPKNRMSASINLLKKSKIGFLLILDESKREAYNNFLDISLILEDCPAKIIREIEDSYLVTNLG